MSKYFLLNNRELAIIGSGERGIQHLVSLAFLIAEIYCLKLLCTTFCLLDNNHFKSGVFASWILSWTSKTACGGFHLQAQPILVY